MAMCPKTHPFCKSPAQGPGLTQAQTSNDMNFDWLDVTQVACEPAEPESAVQVTAPQAFQQQGFQPHGFQPGCMQQAFPQLRQQQPQQLGMKLPQEMNQMLAGGMTAVGVNPIVAGVVANRALNKLNPNGGILAWCPAVFEDLQQLFCVEPSFVLRKLLLLVCPFIRKRSQGIPMNSWGGEVSPCEQASGNRFGRLKVDVDEVDLYIPTMAYVTYVLLYGVHHGIVKEFNPEVLSNTFSFALAMGLFEVGGFYIAFFIAGTPVPALPLTANIGYKYVPCVLMVIARILAGGHAIYWLLFGYLAACAAWSSSRFAMRMVTCQVEERFGAPASPLAAHIITAMAGVQVAMCFILQHGA